MMREHKGRSFNDIKDLTIPEKARDDPDVHNLIPIPCNMTEFRKRGSIAAQAAGIQKPSSREINHYALVSCARDHPLSNPDVDIPNLVRNSMFETDFDNSERDQQLRQWVFERVSDAFKRHTEEPASEFYSWIWGRNNTFVKQIAQKKSVEGGELPKEDVKRTLLELGWESYTYVAGCISQMMQAVFKALPTPFTSEEFKVFEEMHLPRPHFGGLPFILLWDRYEFVESVVLDLCENPGDRRTIQVFHCLLHFYADMSSRRRLIDQDVKRASADEYHDDPGPCKYQLTSESRGNNISSEIADYILEKKGTTCSCSVPVWKSSVTVDPDVRITITAVCSLCHKRRRVIVPWAEFLQIADEHRRREPYDEDS
jgi:hypothetical protein